MTDAYPDVKILRSRRRSFSLELKEEGFVLRIPYLAGRRSVLAFLKKNEKWMEKKRQEQAQRQAFRNAAGPVDAEEEGRLRQQAKELISQRVAYYAPLVGVRPGRITIRMQKTRWGSCSAQGNLSFNCLLMLAPPQVLDAVVVHELCHLKEMNHSSRFYREVLRVYPEYHTWNRWLKREGGMILARRP